MRYFRNLILFFITLMFAFQVNAAFSLFSEKGNITIDNFKNGNIKGFNIGIITDHDEGYYKELKETGAKTVRVIIPFTKCEQTIQSNETPEDVSHIQSKSLEPKCVYKVNKNVIDSFNKLLSQSKKDGFNIIVVGDFEQNPQGDYWTSKKLQQGISIAWQRFAEIYKNENKIAAYDIFNNPNATGLNNPEKVQEFWTYGASNIIQHIREVDSSRPIIYQVPYGDPLVADKIKPLEDKNIIYGFDMFYPYQITFQGMTPKYNERLSYPLGQEFKLDPFGTGEARAINIDDLRLYLSRVNKFSKDNNVPILISAFGIVYYAPNRSGYRYIQDVTTVFKENGFSWMYQGFRINQAMDPYIASENKDAIERTSSAPMISLLIELMSSK